MKMTKKKVFVAALAICLIAIISMGTLAWFNATDDITNNFKVATDENDTDPTFSVKVSETDLDGNETEDGVTYYNVVPGDVINKDPKITNTGDYTQWIRVSVTMTKADYWKNFGGSLKFTDIFEGSTYDYASNVGTATEKWLMVNNAVAPDANGNAVWYLYLNREFAAGSDEILFTEVNIDEDFTLDEIKSLGSEFSITVKADAVQRDNTGDNAVEAFATVGWTAGTEFADKD
ncbi:MAG: SipW-dependent-type signal peptide-containing protein [Acutalibacteraceae bacterium]|nr:SipW-dependent-type signal peptide-containing protein [Acutalibacteraceae bacterium]